MCVCRLSLRESTCVRRLSLRESVCVRRLSLCESVCVRRLSLRESVCVRRLSLRESVCVRRLSLRESVCVRRLSLRESVCVRRLSLRESVCIRRLSLRESTCVRRSSRPPPSDELRITDGKKMTVALDHRIGGTRARGHQDTPVPMGGRQPSCTSLSARDGNRAVRPKRLIADDVARRAHGRLRQLPATRGHRQWSIVPHAPGISTPPVHDGGRRASIHYRALSRAGRSRSPLSRRRGAAPLAQGGSVIRIQAPVIAAQPRLKKSAWILWATLEKRSGHP